MNTQKEYRIEARCHERKTVTGLVKANKEAELNGGIVRITEKTEDSLTMAHIFLDVEDAASWTNYGLSRDFPVQVLIPMEQPEKLVAYYHFNEWWTRPAFIDSFQEIPKTTALLLLKYKDRVACLMPAVGKSFKSSFNGGTEGEICLEMNAGISGIQCVDEPLYYYTEGGSVREAIHRIFTRVIQEKGIRTRKDRRLPDEFRYLGWCSWDAFYTAVDEAGIRAKAAELKEKKVPVRWVLIDDGWLSTELRLLTDFQPNSKFPDGFGPLVKDLKKDGDIRYVGVWHALGGYWGGVKPGSALAEKEAANLCRTVNGQIVPNLENGASFYRDWYRLLRSQGIDFVKVDGQSAAAIYYEDTAPIPAAARGMDEALERGAVLMDNAIINCMGMSMENVLARTTSAVSRNSDDFFPGREDSFREHLLQNAFNSLYHDEIYYCDWDMFWTNHPAAKKHALLRAISGGPVYTSDRVGETVPGELAPLCYLNGELLMLDRSAKATEDCIFRDPFKEGVLKLENSGKWAGQSAGVLAAYNLSGKAQEYSFSAEDIAGLPEAKRYLVYDWFEKSVQFLSTGESIKTALNADGFKLYIVLPADSELSRKSTSAAPALLPLGLTEKYVGVTAVESIHEAAGETVIVLKECGNTAWYCEKEVGKVLLNREDVTKDLKEEGGLYTLEIPEREGKGVLVIR